MRKLLFALLAVVAVPALALAQTTPLPNAPANTAGVPGFAWKIVLKNFLNHTEMVRPEQYPDQTTCELAKQGMGYADLHVLGVHGECTFVPTTYFGHKKKQK